MKIAVVDDEKQWHEITVQNISSFYKNQQVHVETFESGELLLQCQKEYDLVLLDVELKGMDGFETAKIYQKRYPDCTIMMLSMHTELSRRGYVVNAFRYIDKACMADEMTEALSAFEKLRERERMIQVHQVGIGEIPLRLKDIIYIETEKRNVKIHTRTQECLCSENMNYMEEMLADSGFYRCHRSYIINLDRVRSFDHANVYLETRDCVPVSVRKYTELKHRYLEHRFEGASG